MIRATLAALTLTVTPAHALDAFDCSAHYRDAIRASVALSEALYEVSKAEADEEVAALLNAMERVRKHHEAALIYAEEVCASLRR